MIGAICAPLRYRMDNSVMQRTSYFLLLIGMAMTLRQVDPASDASHAQHTRSRSAA